MADEVEGVVAVAFEAPACKTILYKRNSTLGKKALALMVAHRVLPGVVISFKLQMLLRNLDSFKSFIEFNLLLDRVNGSLLDLNFVSKLVVLPLSGARTVHCALLL
jgi:hypothetical protein